MHNTCHLMEVLLCSFQFNGHTLVLDFTHRLKASCHLSFTAYLIPPHRSTAAVFPLDCYPIVRSAFCRRIVCGRGAEGAGGGGVGAWEKGGGRCTGGGRRGGEKRDFPGSGRQEI